MPRGRRVAPRGLVYHVLNRGVARLALFEKDADYEAFERVLVSITDRRNSKLQGAIVTDMMLSPDKSEPTAELSLYELVAKIARETLGLSSGAQPPEDESSSVKHVLFVLDDTQYAVPMENVLELQRLPRVAPLPTVAGWLRGAANLRGDVLSVVDLRSLLGLPAVKSSASQRLIVVRSTLEEIATGWIVDRVIGVRRLATGDMQPTSTLATGASTRFLNGIVEYDNHLIAVLDVNRVLSSPEMRQFEPTWQAA